MILVERQADDPDPEDGIFHLCLLGIEARSLTRSFCRTGYGAKRNTFVMGFIYPHHAADSGSLRQLSAATQENSGRA